MDPTQSPPETTISELPKDVLTDMLTDVLTDVLTDNYNQIMSLPNDVLTHILSLLSTKEAVHTSLLVEMFQNLWAAVPALHFDFNEFCQDEEDICDIEEKFTNFVDGVLKHRDPSINLDSFKLKWDEDESNPIPATKWLDIVAKLKPKFLSVHIFTENYFQVPDSIFSCKSLQEMELHLGFEAISPTSVNLPCLKKVTLHSIRIEDEVMQMLSGLPALEEMVLSNCHFNTCDISSVTLKRLVLNGYHNERTPPPDISISTPNLLYLEVHSWSLGSIKLKKLESLVKACIHYHEFANEDFLTGLSNATYLELMLPESGVLDVLEEETTKFPTFNNLKTLKIGEWCMSDEFDVVERFLFHARNLEKLTLLHRHRQSQPGHDKMEISLGLAGNNIHIMEINGKKNDKIKDDIIEQVKRVYKTHLKIRHEMKIISS